jgi:hypothetical protein
MPRASYKPRWICWNKFETAQARFSEQLRHYFFRRHTEQKRAGLKIRKLSPRVFLFRVP